MRFVSCFLVGFLVGGTATCMAASFYSVTELPAPLGTVSHGSAINNLGEVVGSYGLGTGPLTSNVVFSNGQVTNLPTPTGYSYLDARSINDSGLVTGQVMNNFGFQAFLYDHGRVTLLGTSPVFDWTVGVSINNAGQIAGTSRANGAFIYTNGAMLDLKLGPSTLPESTMPVSS